MSKYQPEKDGGVKLGDEFIYAENGDSEITGKVININDSNMVELKLSNGETVWSNPRLLFKKSKGGKAPAKAAAAKSAK